MFFPFYFKLPAQRTYRTLAVIISAAMSSTASGLNALASTTAIDKRNLKEEKKALSQRDKVLPCFGL
jgi:hypothetical protein